MVVNKKLLNILLKERSFKRRRKRSKREYQGNRQKHDKNEKTS